MWARDRDQRLPRAGRRGQDDVVAAEQLEDRLVLVRVELEPLLLDPRRRTRRTRASGSVTSTVGSESFSLVTIPGPRVGGARRPRAGCRRSPACRPAWWSPRRGPSSSCTTRTSAPPSSRWVAKEWRSVCGETSRVTPARSAALASTAQALCRDSRPPRALRNSAPAGRLARDDQLGAGPDQVGLDRLARRTTRRAPAAPWTPLPRSSTVPVDQVEVVDVEARPPRRSGRRCRRAPRAAPGRAAPAPCRRRPAASRIASTSASGSALGSRLAGVGGFTAAAGSLARPARRARRTCGTRAPRPGCAPPRSPTSGGWSASPSRSRTRKPETVASVTPSSVVDALRREGSR